MRESFILIDWRNSMKILVIHNRYREFGGEDSVVNNEINLLLDKGQKVYLYERNNREFSKRNPILLFSSFLSFRSKREVKEICKKEKPDIVHIHNTFPLISASIYSVIQEHRIPVVQSLHNYRHFCINGVFSRNGKICEKCITGSLFSGIKYRCYRESYAQSAVATSILIWNRRKKIYHKHVNRFIALSKFSKNKYISLGLPRERITIKPNFTKEIAVQNKDERKGGIYVGRLSRDKGVSILARALVKVDNPHFKVVGEGELVDEILSQDIALYLGAMSAEEVRKEMSKASFLVVPSLTFEHFPQVIVEAFSMGLPVIASRLGAMEEIIEDGETGLHFSPGDSDDLAKKVTWAEQNPHEMRRMGANARRIYEEKYTSENNYQMLMAIYKEAIADAAGRN